MHKSKKKRLKVIQWQLNSWKKEKRRWSNKCHSINNRRKKKQKCSHGLVYTNIPRVPSSLSISSAPPQSHNHSSVSVCVQALNVSWHHPLPLHMQWSIAIITNYFFFFFVPLYHRGRNIVPTGSLDDRYFNKFFHSSFCGLKIIMGRFKECEKTQENPTTVIWARPWILESTFLILIIHLLLLFLHYHTAFLPWTEVTLKQLVLGL